MKSIQKMIQEEMDVEVVNRQPTPEEQKEISAFIRADKAKNIKSVSRSARPVKA